MRAQKLVVPVGMVGLWVAATWAAALTVRPQTLEEGSSWTVLAVSRADDPGWIGTIDERGTYWDLRPSRAAVRLVRYRVMLPQDAGLSRQAEEVGADRALCATAEEDGAPLGCSLFRDAERRAAGPAPRWSSAPDEPVLLRSTLSAETGLEVGVEYEEVWRRADGSQFEVHGRAVAEGVALLPAGPHEVVLLRESAGSRLRYRFLTVTGEVVAWLEGPRPEPGQSFRPERGELRASPAASNGITIPYTSLSGALVPGRLGFLQYSQETAVSLSALNPDWTDVPHMLSIDATGVSYQPDPTNPASAQTLPEVWDFTGLVKNAIPYRTFNTIRSGLAGNVCRENCAVYNPGPNPPDGTWQAFLKIDNYQPGGAFLTRDIFDLNDNDTGANPSIDVPYVAQNESNVDNGRTQICFQQSAGGVNRLLRFFRFFGATPATATMKMGDTWSSGNWTECDNDHGLKLTASSLCDNACWPQCGTVNPRARGLLGGGVGIRSTVVEDGWVHVAAGNYLPALLLQQETDIEAGIDLFGVCTLSPQRNHAFDYFWLHEDYGLLALVSSPENDAIEAQDWSVVSNQTDGADFTWGPFPPWQFSAAACLSGTKISWALPADGSNLTGSPGVSQYGYVVGWGSLTDPDDLADFTLNPNHTPLPGQAGYLIAPAGGEPTSKLVTGWGGPSLNATVVTALRYTDPDVADQKTYYSPAFYKVSANPAVLNPATFKVGQSVAPFVSKNGANLKLAWPVVAGALSYHLRVWNLDTGLEIACPAGLDCHPLLPQATHVGATTTKANYGYRAFAVDPCGAESAD